MNEEIKIGSHVEMEQEGNATEEKQAPPYWCVVCGRAIQNDGGLYIHDNKPGHEFLTFDEENKPQ